jgi:hypothetical protein
MQRFRCHKETFLRSAKGVCGSFCAGKSDWQSCCDPSMHACIASTNIATNSLEQGRWSHLNLAQAGLTTHTCIATLRLFLFGARAQAWRNACKPWSYRARTGERILASALRAHEHLHGSLTQCRLTHIQHILTILFSTEHTTRANIYLCDVRYVQGVDSELTEQGMEQAAKLGEHLSNIKVDAIFSSHLKVRLKCNWIKPVWDVRFVPIAFLDVCQILSTIRCLLITRGGWCPKAFERHQFATEIF